MLRQIKEKRSFTLAPASVAYLERLKKERRASSVSHVLDELIREAETRRRREALEEAIAAHYNSLTAEELREEQAWGKFAMQQLAKEGK